MSGREGAPVLGGFVLVCAFSFLATMVTALPHHFAGYADAVGLGAAVGALMVSACMVVNAFGKVCMGWAIDRFGLARASVVDMCLVACGALVLACVPQVPAVYVGAALVGGSYALVTVVLSVLVRRVFGDGGYGRVFPVVNVASTLGTAVGAPVVGLCFDLTGGYGLALVGAAVILAACLAIQICLLWRRA